MGWRDINTNEPVDADTVKWLDAALWTAQDQGDNEGATHTSGMVNDGIGFIRITWVMAGLDDDGDQDGNWIGISVINPATNPVTVRAVWDGEDPDEPEEEEDYGDGEEDEDDHEVVATPVAEAPPAKWEPPPTIGGDRTVTVYETQSSMWYFDMATMTYSRIWKKKGLTAARMGDNPGDPQGTPLSEATEYPFNHIEVNSSRLRIFVTNPEGAVHLLGEGYANPTILGKGRRSAYK